MVRRTLSAAVLVVATACGDSNPSGPSTFLVERVKRLFVVTPYSGSDPGAGPNNPRENSNIAAANFDEAAGSLGTVIIESFESAPSGYFESLQLSSMTVTMSGTSQ